MGNEIRYFLVTLLIGCFSTYTLAQSSDGRQRNSRSNSTNTAKLQKSSEAANHTITEEQISRPYSQSSNDRPAISNSNQVSPTASDGRLASVDSIPLDWTNLRYLTDEALKRCVSNSRSPEVVLGPFNFSNPGLDATEIGCQQAAFVLRSDGVNLEPAFAYRTASGVIYGTWKEWDQGVYFPVSRILDAWIDGLDQSWGIARGNFGGIERSFTSQTQDFSVAEFSVRGKGNGFVFDPKSERDMGAVWYDAPVLLIEAGQKPVSGLISLYVRGAGGGDTKATLELTQIIQTVFRSMTFRRSGTTRLSVAEYRKLAPRIKPDERLNVSGQLSQGQTTQQAGAIETATPRSKAEAKSGDSGVGEASKFQRLLTLVLNSKTNESAKDPNLMIRECEEIQRQTKAVVVGFSSSDPVVRAARKFCDDFIQWEIILERAGERSELAVYRYLLGSYATALNLQRLRGNDEQFRTLVADLKTFAARIYAVRGLNNPFERIDNPPSGFDEWVHAPSGQFMKLHGRGTKFQVWVTREPICITDADPAPQGMKKLGASAELFSSVASEEIELAKRLEAMSSMGNGCSFYALTR